MSSLLHGFEYLSTRDCCLISFNLAVFNWLSFVIIYGLGIRLNSQMNEVLVSSVFIIFVLQEKHSMACCQAYHILKRITSPSTISENPAPYVCGVLSHLPEFRYTPGSTHLVWLFPLSLSLSPVHVHTHTHNHIPMYVHTILFSEYTSPEPSCKMDAGWKVWSAFPFLNLSPKLHDRICDGWCFLNYQESMNDIDFRFERIALKSILCHFQVLWSGAVA